MTYAGDSYGGVQSAILQDRAMRQRAFQEAMGNYFTGQQMQASRAAGARQFQFEQLRNQQQLEMQQRELALRQQEALTQAARYAGQSELGKGYLDLYNRQMEWQQGQPTPQAARAQTFDEQMAVRQAATGQFDDADHVQKLYPWMSKSQAGLLASQSQDTRAQIGSEYNTSKNAAALLNRNQELVQKLSTYGVKPGDVAPKAGWFTSADTANKYKAIGDTLNEYKDISTKAAAIQADKRLSSLVTFDPDSGQYLPTIPAPRWATSVKGGGTEQAPTAPTLEAPQGWQPVNGGGAWQRPVMPGMPNRSLAGVMPSTSGTATMPSGAVAAPMTGTMGAPASPLGNPAVHARVNALIQGGMDPSVAAQQALGEYQQAFSGGSLP